MNILVYGGNGWIGQQFTELLNTMKSDVIRLSLLYNYGGLWIMLEITYWLQ